MSKSKEYPVGRGAISQRFRALAVKLGLAPAPTLPPTVIYTSPGTVWVEIPLSGFRPREHETHSRPGCFGEPMTPVEVRRWADLIEEAGIDSQGFAATLRAAADHAEQEVVGDRA